jgi:hypothetical protein
MAGKQTQDNALKVESAHDKYLAEFVKLAELLDNDTTQNNIAKQILQCKGDKISLDGEEHDGIDWDSTMREIAKKSVKTGESAPKISHKTFVRALSKSTSEQGEHLRRLMLVYWQSQFESIAPKKLLYLFASMSESGLLGEMPLDAELVKVLKALADYIMAQDKEYTCYRDIFSKGKTNAKNISI